MTQREESYSGQKPPWVHDGIPAERLRMRRMAYNQNCPMFRHLPLWERIVLAWVLG